MDSAVYLAEGGGSKVVVLHGRVYVDEDRSLPQTQREATCRLAAAAVAISSGAQRTSTSRSP